MPDLQAEAKLLATQTKHALLSGTWFYPLEGIYYTLSHPQIFHTVIPILTKCLLLSTGVTVGLFLFTYLPQVAFCAIFSGPVLAWPAAAVMVLGEVYVLTVFLSKTLFLDKAQNLIFDTVLVQQGHNDLVSRGREIKQVGSSGITKVGKAALKPLDRFSKEGIMSYILSLPLNTIPVVGTVLFLLYNGRKSGPRYHARYFQLKSLSPVAQNEFIQTHDAEYVAFGASAIALGFIPIVGLLFRFTTTAGAALWASALEKHTRSPIPANEEEKVVIEDGSDSGGKQD